MHTKYANTSPPSFPCSHLPHGNNNITFLVNITFNVSMNNTMFMQYIDSSRDLLWVQPNDMLLKAQFWYLLQSALITVLHEDVHFFLFWEPNQISFGVIFFYFKHWIKIKFSLHPSLFVK